ncbi:MAG: hypothetical protein ABIE36_03730 [Candidatus Diapherotrites archaeon]
MGFIRGAIITLFSFVLLISLFLMSLSLILSWSLEHDTFQLVLGDSAKDILKDFLGSENIIGEGEEIYMKNYCLLNSEYKFTYENYDFIFPCEVIEKGRDSIIDYGADYFVDTLYYAEYDCEFWKCVKDSSIPLVLFSEKARDYWRNKFILLLVLSFVLFALIFLISKNKHVTLIITGVLLILSVLPFRKLNWVLTFMPDEFSGIFSLFFTKSHSVFIIILIIGLILIGIGFLFRLFGWSMNFMKWLSKNPEEEENISKLEVRDIVKEEISKKNQLKPKKKK